MKAIIFALTLLMLIFSTTSVSYTYGTTSTQKPIDEDAEQVLCTDKPYPDHPNETSYDYCRTLYINKNTTYRCCYVKGDDNQGGCIETTYSDFASEDSIKDVIANLSNAEIDCSAKFFGVSLISLIIALL